MHKPGKTLVGTLVGMMCLAGCGSSGGEATSEPAAEASAGGESGEATMGSYEGPIESTDAEHGKTLFDDYCGDCHPDAGEDVGPSLIATPHTPARIRQQIREGSGKMRPFAEKRLSDQDVETILAWLDSVKAVK